MKNRNGSYKKVLLAADHLGPHREALIKNIDLMTKLPLAPYELCTLYILLFLRIRHPKNWLQKKSIFTPSPSEKKILDLIPESFNLTLWEIEKLKDISVKELFEHFNLKGIPQAVNRTMLNWARGHWKIELLTYIPGPRKLLQMQVRETRCITLTVNHDEIDSLVLSTRDPLSFVLHDLHHADMFFNQESLKGQLGFYNLVNQIYDEPEIKQTLKKDNQFKSEFDYVVSDMNAYVIHLFKCFKSAFIRSDEELFSKVLAWWDMPPHVLAASKRLNTPDFHAEDEFNLKHFFENSREALV
jgi:hypothetical protein